MEQRKQERHDDSHNSQETAVFQSVRKTDTHDGAESKKGKSKASNRQSKVEHGQEHGHAEHGDHLVNEHEGGQAVKKTKPRHSTAQHLHRTSTDVGHGAHPEQTPGAGHPKRQDSFVNHEQSQGFGREIKQQRGEKNLHHEQRKSSCIKWDSRRSNLSRTSIATAIPYQTISSSQFSLDHIEEKTKDSLAYSFVTQEQCAIIMEQTPHKMTKSIAGFLKFRDIDLNLREAIIVDYYVCGLCWARDKQHFSEEQVSAIATILKIVYENIAEKGFDFQQTAADFRDLFTGIVDTESSDISGGLNLFDLPQAKAIMDYFAKSVLMSFKLHRYVFTGKQTPYVLTSEKEMNIPKSVYKTWPPPLHEALPRAVYQDIVAPPTSELNTGQLQCELGTATCLGEEGGTSTNRGIDSEAFPQKEIETTAEPRLSEAHQSSHLASDRHHPVPAHASQSPSPGVSGDEKKLVVTISALSKQEIHKAFQEVLEEELGQYKDRVLAKLRMKENEFIREINQIYVTQNSANESGNNIDV